MGGGLWGRRSSRAPLPSDLLLWPPQSFCISQCPLPTPQWSHVSPKQYQTWGPQGEPQSLVPHLQQALTLDMLFLLSLSFLICKWG